MAPSRSTRFPALASGTGRTNGSRLPSGLQILAHWPSAGHGTMAAGKRPRASDQRDL